MQQLTTNGERIIKDLAQRYGVSDDAVMTLAQALIAGNGTMAQFNHPDLGGYGQWMRGGMTMVGDLSNHSLKSKVDSLCSELAKLMAAPPDPGKPQSSHSQDETSLFVAPAAGDSRQWWPSELNLGTPGATGSQNTTRYAYFPAAHRLAVDNDGRITVYDTLDHRIGGVSQQQGAGASLKFTSQSGEVALADLPIVAGGAASEKQPPPAGS